MCGLPDAVLAGFAVGSIRVLDEQFFSQNPRLRITNLAPNHFRKQENRIPTLAGAWYRAPKQAGCPQCS